MTDIDIINDRIKKKEGEISQLERRIEAARAYLQALRDIKKVLDREPRADAPETVLRRGSTVSQAREYILRHGSPAHIDELLEGLDRPATRENKASLTGSLSAYVRRGEIFSRTAPNTYGLVELGHHGNPEEDQGDLELPSDFGQAEPDPQL